MHPSGAHGARDAPAQQGLGRIACMLHTMQLCCRHCPWKLGLAYRVARAAPPATCGVTETRCSM